MGYQAYPPASAGKTQYSTTLTSGTSYTVPAGVNYLIVTTIGGGGGGGGAAGGNANSNGNAGGTTTFTGATSASGGNGGSTSAQRNNVNNVSQPVSSGASGVAYGDAGTGSWQIDTNNYVSTADGIAGTAGQKVTSVVNTSGGSTINYSIGAGGTGGAGNGSSGSGGNGAQGAIFIDYWV